MLRGNISNAGAPLLYSV
jgi:hypothetical protein